MKSETIIFVFCILVISFIYKLVDCFCKLFFFIDVALNNQVTLTPISNKIAKLGDPVSYYG